MRFKNKKFYLYAEIWNGDRQKYIYIYGKQKTQIKMVQPGSNISAILITEKD